MVRRSSPKSKHKKVETKKYNTKGKQQKTKNSGSGLSKLQSPSTKLTDSKSPIKESKNQLKRKVKVLVGKKDVNKVFNLFLKLKKAIINPSLEYGYARTSSGNIVKLIRDKKNHLIFPEDLQKEGHKKGLHTVIHNHPKGTSPLASPEDIRSYAEYRIKYGISTNDKGTFRVKNNNGEAMSEKQLDSIEEKNI